MKPKSHDIAEALRQRDLGQLLALLNWKTDRVPIAGGAWRAWGWFGEPYDGALLARAPGCRVIGVVGPVKRELVVAVARHAPLETFVWFFDTADELTLAFAERDAGGGVRLRSMSLDPTRPDPMGLERLSMLDRAAFARPDELDPSAATAAHLREVLDQEPLTRAFFTGFRDALELLAATMIDGPKTAEERWQASLVVLLRLVFVYFLQREGYLDGDRRWVVRRLRTHRADFYEEVLRPLFFGVLNTPTNERDRVSAKLGDIPFLNGGLFEPTPTETTHPGLRWASDQLGEIIESLFERFHFTAAEPTGEDAARVVDPEMLGKVFEGLMVDAERRRSGAFYTPRDLVRRIVDRAIDAHIEDRRAEGVDLDAALGELRILDPAVGTGAFLLEALASLRLRRHEAGLPVDYAALRQVVHDHLFGVDRNRTAVRLCELRLWLVMLTAMRDETGPLAPLPNLSQRIVAGDSLLDGVDLVRRRAGALHPEALIRIVQLESRLEHAQRSFLESHGVDKARCRVEIERLERELQLALVAGRRSLLVHRLNPLRVVRASRDLFGDSMATAEQERWAEDIEAEVTGLDARASHIERGLGGAPGFGYESRFGMAAREGFDIVVTNPPWVRAHHLERDLRDVLSQRYQTASGRLWGGAGELGIRAPYGSQPDLAALFIERSLELLRPGGRLAALIPAKLFRTLHASPLRRLLGSHSVEEIEDLSDANRQLFDATVYPGILHVRKERLAEHVDVRLWRGDDVERFRRTPADLSFGEPGAPWLLAPDDIASAIQRLRAATTMLGEDAELGPCRGVFTGANDLFIRPRGGFEREFGAIARPWVRPVIAGSGLGTDPESEILWCYAETAPVDELPTELVNYFERHERRLRKRSDYDRRGPLWQVFRVRPDTYGCKVAWRDMSVLLEPVVVGSDAVPLNTVYYVPFDDPDEAVGFARWMSSTPVRAVAYALAERARGGWRRHFAWVVRMLPVPDLPDGWASFHGWGEHGVTARDEALFARWIGNDTQAAAA